MALMRCDAKIILKEKTMRLHITSSRPLVTLLMGIGLMTAYSASAAPMAPLPPEHVVGDISYLSGGVGKDEADAMKQAATQYPLELMFLTREKDGHEAYKSGDKVMIRDHSGKIVLDTQSDGPIMLAKLPPGKYKVEAIDHGKAEYRTVTLKPDKHAELAFKW